MNLDNWCTPEQEHGAKMEKAHEVLKNTFGFASFRLEQEAVRNVVFQCAL